MPKACAVPKCKTGYRSAKEKCSVFRVPRKVEQYKKWLAAIPGNALKQSQYVCEKHFEDKYIIRLWQKCDENGRILAQSPYHHPRLDEFAVPTIFDSIEVKQESADSVLDRDTLNFPDVPDVKVGDLSSMDGIDTSGSIRDEAQQYIVPDNILVQDSVIGTNIISPPKLIQCVFVPLPELIQGESTLSNKFAKHNVLPPRKVDSTAPSIHDRSSVKSVSTAPEKNFDIFTTIYDPRSECSITLPKSWRCEESFSEKGQRIIFSRSVMRQDNEVQVPVMEKSVTLDADRALRYAVYGRAVYPEGCELPRVLKDTALLPNILETFKNTNVCSGLGAVNIYYASVDAAFKDCIDQWRPTECVMLSKLKRCEPCRKMRQRLLKREKRSKEDRTPERVLQASNPIDQRKLLALRKRSSRERRLKNRAKFLGELLRQSLREKQIDKK